MHDGNPDRAHADEALGGALLLALRAILGTPDALDDAGVEPGPAEDDTSFP